MHSIKGTALLLIVALIHLNLLAVTQSCNSRNRNTETTPVTPEVQVTEAVVEFNTTESQDPVDSDEQVMSYGGGASNIFGVLDKPKCRGNRYYDKPSKLCKPKQ